MTLSRRTVLAACGAGLAALAGCASLDPVESTPSLDLGRVDAISQRDVPRPPATLPVSVPASMVSGHHDRARALVEQVPEQPDLPSDDVRERLMDERQSVLDRLETADANDHEGAPLRRLAAARSIREDAAAVGAAYRAATGDITQQAVADRRTELRSAVLNFERDWTYRGDDPASAVVVHRAFEDLRQNARSGLSPSQAYPQDPASDAFVVAELVQHLERGEAALADALTLRTRYREGLSDTRPYRTAISVAASRLQRPIEQYREDLHFYIDADIEELPFDEPIAETPLRWLYFWAVDGLDVFRSDAEVAELRGAPATVLISRAILLTVLRALDTIVADIEHDRVTVPETVDGIAAARQAAIEELEQAWSTSPAVLAVAVAHWAERLVFDVKDRRRGPAIEAGETPDTREAYDIWAEYVAAKAVAAAVPPTVADFQDALRAATE